MKTRTKVFLVALLIAALIASVISGEPRLLAYAAVLYVLAWLAWRFFAFVFVLLKPVRDWLRPLNDHVDATARKTGLGKLTDLDNKLRAGIRGAVDATHAGTKDQ